MHSLWLLVCWSCVSNFMIVWPCIVTDSLWIKPTDALNSNAVVTVCYQKQDGTVFHPTPRSKQSQLHKVYQSRCMAKNSWWWAERLPETCSNTNKIGIQCICWFYWQGIVYQNSTSGHAGMPTSRCVVLFTYGPRDGLIPNHKSWQVSFTWNEAEISFQ